MKIKNKKYWNFCGIHHIKMFGISKKTYERNCTETILDMDGILWLNKKTYRREGLDHKKLR